MTNKAHLDGTTSGNDNKEIDSNEADLNIEKSDTFVSVPSLIDFGSTNMYGESKILNNVSTDGDLIVSHPDDNNFNINVSYDNDNTATQMKNQNDNTLPTDNSNLIFIRQRNNSDKDAGSWSPISPTGTSIRSTPFTGKQDNLNLTNYVGVGDWQIHLSSDTLPGTYNGTLTWTMIDSDS